MKIEDVTFEQRVARAISTGAYLEDTEFNLDMTFSDLGLESMDFLEIIFEIEEEFNVQIPIDEYVNIEEMNGHKLIAQLKKFIEADVEKNESSLKRTVDATE